MLPDWDFYGDDAKRRAFIRWVEAELDRFAMLTADRYAKAEYRDDWPAVLAGSKPVTRVGRPAQAFDAMNAMIWEFGLLRYMFGRYWPDRKRPIRDAASAVNIAVGGSYTLANWFDPQGKPRTFACRTSRVSPFRMIVDVPVVGRIGDRVTPYFSDFGKLDGHISDTIAGGFLLELTMDKPTREKMAGQLSWLERKLKDSSIRDARAQARIIPAKPHSALTFADGAIHSCFVIDMSVSGAAISARSL